MNDLKYVINQKDFEGLTKEEVIENLKVLWERNKSELLRFNATEKERLRLLDENLNLKERFGELIIVKQLMDSAGMYGYNDFLKLKQDAKRDNGE